MQQPVQPIPAAPPTFTELVVGTMLGYLGCFLAMFVLGLCLFIMASMLGISLLSRIPQPLPPIR